MKRLILSLVAGLSLASLSGQADAPKLNISNGILKSLLYLPDAENGYYRGTRFDWSGNMASLEYEGHNFYGQWFEQYNPQTHDAIMGPVEEFGQLGFDEASIGGTFLKIGVGLLIKPDEKPYSNFRLYQIKNGGTWKVKSKSDRVIFTHTLNDEERGYVYTKEIRLLKGEAGMIISHTLINKGRKPIETTVYNHNFPVIDGQPTGPGYKISFPFSLSGCSGQGFGEIIQIRDKSLVYLKSQEKDDRVYCGEMKGFSSKPEDYDIRIENSIASAGIRIRSDQPISRLVYWSSSTTACPEPYTKITVAPGKRLSWNLSYEYYLLDPGKK